ncbi:hypothetical protein LIER_09675 [Lithospermum erythrorhizon]|uniref:Uncharacterized protein n=1 Tax=Lithospermum erythrorhizon TaxID=34254 RepID=A0AAV3PIH9_LITER
MRKSGKYIDKTPGGGRVQGYKLFPVVEGLRRRWKQERGNPFQLHHRKEGKLGISYWKLRTESVRMVPAVLQLRGGPVERRWDRRSATSPVSLSTSASPVWATRRATSLSSLASATCWAPRWLPATKEKDDKMSWKEKAIGQKGKIRRGEGIRRPPMRGPWRSRYYPLYEEKNRLPGEDSAVSRKSILPLASPS